MTLTVRRNFSCKIKDIGRRIAASVQKNFVFGTLNFIFTVIYINAFQVFFGAENSIIAIIMTILMGICAGRDVTNAPFKQFFKQISVFCWMATAACLTLSFGPWLAIPINLITVFVITYAFTYEYSRHLYFPYLLSYLFLIFISPVPLARLPLRLLGVAVSAVIMILYALVLYRRNIVKPADKILRRLLLLAQRDITALLQGEKTADNLLEARRLMQALSANLGDRGVNAGKLPVKAALLLDFGRGLESLIIMLSDCRNRNLAPDVLKYAAARLNYIQLDLAKKVDSNGAGPDRPPLANGFAAEFVDTVDFIAAKLRLYKLKSGCVKTPLPLKAKLKVLLGYSPVRLVYALRAALLITVFIIPVQYFALPHGKWLLFTVASVSLPYAEDVRPKAVKRLAATLIGGMISVLLYSLLPGAGWRTAVMMLSGYLSFYFAGYIGNYACATVGALGGAVFTTCFGLREVALMFGIRLGYIVLGIAVALIFNVLICPFKRVKASRRLFIDYEKTALALAGGTSLPASVYYSLVIRCNLLESKLNENAQKAGYKEIAAVIAPYRRRIRAAHRAGAVTVVP